MSALIRCYPGDRGLDFFLVVTLGVALASSAAWLISRRIAGKAALRHLILFSALIFCLAYPAVAWLCSAKGLIFVSFPILPGEDGKTASEITLIETTTPVWIPPQQATVPATNQSPVTPTLSPDDMRHASSLAGTLVLFRGIATGAIFIWAAGTLLMLARLAVKCARVAQLRRSSRPLQNESHASLLHEVAAKLRTRSVPLLLASSHSVTPLAVGFGRPAVILPERLLGAVNHNELRDVLIHEVAHLQRGDQRIVLLQELAGALYWPIVSVHGLNRELRRAREELCDNVVLTGRDAISYGETLLRVAELLVKSHTPVGAIGMFGGKGELERRVAGLLDPRRNTMTTTSGKAARFVLFAFIAWGAIASTTRFTASGSAAQTASPNQEPPNPDAKEQEKVISEIKKLGGRVEFDAKSPGTPVEEVDLANTPVTDEWLVHLEGMTALRELYLHHTPVTDAGLAHLEGLSKLRGLTLANNEVTDEGLAHLKDLTGLQQLSLKGTRVTDAGLVHLKRFNRLEFLDLGNTKVTDAGLIHLQGLSGLRELHLIATPVTDKGLECLKSLTQLRQLSLGGTKVTDAGLAHVQGFSKLQGLNLDGTTVTDLGLAHLKGLTELEWLMISNTPVTDAGLAHLKGLSRLKAIYLGGAKVTDKGIADIQRALPKTQIFQ